MAYFLPDQKGCASISNVLGNLKSKGLADPQTRRCQKNEKHLSPSLDTNNDCRDCRTVERRTFLVFLFHGRQVKVLIIPNHRVQWLASLEVLSRCHDGLDHFDVLLTTLGSEFLTSHHHGYQFFNRVIVNSG